jgi:HTH-type transcriptional regulator / antitoxin HigA
VIRNDKEYAIAKAELARFQSVLDSFDVVAEIEAGVDPVIARAHQSSFASKVSELRSEIRDFDRLKAGNLEQIGVTEIRALGEALIKARVARGLSQKSLAEVAGLKEQQIQRYEKELYQTANLKRLSLIAQSLNVSFDGSLAPIFDELQDNETLYGFNETDFPFLEMRKAGWFGDEVRNLARVDRSLRLAVLSSFFKSGPQGLGRALHRKTPGKSSATTEAALIAWQSRVVSKAMEVADDYPRFTPLDGETISRLAKLSSKPEGIAEAIQLLRRHGIILIIEPHLPRTRLDGAALSVDGRQGVIAMTIRFDRIDNFWFVLLHELGHLCRHWEHVVTKGILDEDTTSEAVDLIEREADEFAENAILSSNIWRGSMIRFSRDANEVVAFAQRHSLHPALVAGRIRRERGYHEFSDLVCEQSVKSELAELGYWR